MSLSSLAVVEVQLIMQRCDRRTLLHLARCSRSLRAHASSPFAWRFCMDPVPIVLAPISGEGAGPGDDGQQLVRHLHCRTAFTAAAQHAHLKSLLIRLRRHGGPLRFASLAVRIPTCWTQVDNAFARVLHERHVRVRVLDLRAAVISAAGTQALFRRKWPHLHELRLGPRCILSGSGAESLVANAAQIRTLALELTVLVRDEHVREFNPWSPTIWPHRLLLPLLVHLPALSALELAHCWSRCSEKLMSHVIEPILIPLFEQAPLHSVSFSGMGWAHLAPLLLLAPGAAAVETLEHVRITRSSIGGYNGNEAEVRRLLTRHLQRLKSLEIFRWDQPE
jgi:hypothetical protein